MRGEICRKVEYNPTPPLTIRHRGVEFNCTSKIESNICDRMFFEFSITLSVFASLLHYISTKIRVSAFVSAVSAFV